MSGPRLYLSQCTPDDIDDEFAQMYEASGGHNRYFRQSGEPFTKAQLRLYCSNGIEKNDCFYFAVKTVEADHLVGSIRLGVIDSKNSLSDLVTLIANAGDRGKGLGTEAIKLGNRVAFDHFGIRKLHGGVLAENVGSLRSYLRAGWIEEGRLLNHCIVEGRPMDWILISCFNPYWEPREPKGPAGDARLSG